MRVSTTDAQISICVRFELDLAVIYLLDINECRDQLDICGGGRCENEVGGYRCICTDGFELSANQIKCSGK